MYLIGGKNMNNKVKEIKNSIMKPKFCVDCEFYNKPRVETEEEARVKERKWWDYAFPILPYPPYPMYYFEAQCSEVTDLVTGGPLLISCERRRKGDDCGPDGKRWKLRSKN